MAFTPDWQYSVGGYLSNEQKLKNQKAISYFLFNTYNYIHEATVLAMMAWIDFLSLDNPGYIDNGNYSSRNGRGFLLWPQSPLNSYAADLGLPWYDGRMQLAFLDYYAGDTWTGAAPWPTWSSWKTRTFPSSTWPEDLPTLVRTQANDLYYYHLRQFVINIPEASYGHDISDGMGNNLVSIARRLLPYLNNWIRTGWADTAPTWLLFAFNQKKGGGKLIL